jgi:hypothetical protein
MPLILTVDQIDQTAKSLVVRGRLTANGSYTTTGVAVDFTVAVLPLGQSLGVSKLPRTVFMEGSTGHSYGWVPGTTLANGKAIIFTTAGTELSAAAFPAGILADTAIYFEAVFDKNL